MLLAQLIDSSSTKLEEQTLKLQLAHSGLYAANTLGGEFTGMCYIS